MSIWKWKCSVGFGQTIYLSSAMNENLGQEECNSFFIHMWLGMKGE